jgi:hypothetical protein
MQPNCNGDGDEYGHPDHLCCCLAEREFGQDSMDLVVAACLLRHFCSVDWVISPSNRSCWMLMHSKTCPWIPVLETPSLVF